MILFHFYFVDYIFSLYTKIIIRMIIFRWTFISTIMNCYIIYPILIMIYPLIVVNFCFYSFKWFIIDFRKIFILARCIIPVYVISWRLIFRTSINLLITLMDYIIIGWWNLMIIFCLIIKMILFYWLTNWYFVMMINYILLRIWSLLLLILIL